MHQRVLVRRHLQRRVMRKPNTLSRHRLRYIQRLQQHERRLRYLHVTREWSYGVQQALPGFCAMHLSCITRQISCEIAMEPVLFSWMSASANQSS